jgi:hypothetical protein
MRLLRMMNEMDNEPQFLYLTTIGWKTGNPHEIEIWFVAHDGRYYVVSELHERRIGSRTSVTIRC